MSPPLSSYPTAQAWLAQFDRAPADRTYAAAMLDAMMLLNEEQVSAAIRTQLYRFGNLKRHRLRPGVMVEHVPPTLAGSGWQQEFAWYDLVNGYGPDAGRGAPRWGFGNSGALIAFNYRIPNNTPAILHKSEGGWRALYEGAAPNDLRPAFGLRSEIEAVAAAASTTGVNGHDLGRKCAARSHDH